MAFAPAVLASSASAEETCPNAELRVGPSAGLPDCRAYEQVSPVEKGGRDAVTLQPMLPAQASACEGTEPCTIVLLSGASSCQAGVHVCALKRSSTGVPAMFVVVAAMVDTPMLVITSKI